MPDTPKSLYLKGAGFLYTDDWTWDDTMNLFRPLNDTESAEETTSRASLRDSIRYTCASTQPPPSKILLTSLHQHHGLSKKLTPLIMLKFSSKTTSSSMSRAETVEDISPSK